MERMDEVADKDLKLTRDGINEYFHRFIRFRGFSYPDTVRVASENTGVPIDKVEELFDARYEDLLKREVPPRLDHPLGTRRHTLVRHRDISRKEPGIWQAAKTKGKTRVYVRCTYCSAINDISHYPIRKDQREHTTRGFTPVTRCVTCVQCRKHQWLCLDEWKAR